MTAVLHEKMRTTKKPLGRGTDIISQTSPLVKGFFTFFCIFLKVFLKFSTLYIYARVGEWDHINPINQITTRAVRVTKVSTVTP